MNDLDAIRNDWLKRIDAAGDLASLEALRVEALGRSGAVTALMKTLGTIPADQRRAHGVELNTLKEAITAALEAKKDALSSGALAAKLAA